MHLKLLTQLQLWLSSYFKIKAMTSEHGIFNNVVRLLIATMRWARSHVKDYVKSLDDQNEQFFKHIQDA